MYMCICIYMHTRVCSLVTSNYIHIFIYNLPTSINKIPETIYIYVYIYGILSSEFNVKHRMNSYAHKIEYLLFAVYTSTKAKVLAENPILHLKLVFIK